MHSLQSASKLKYAPSEAQKQRDELWRETYAEARSEYLYAGNHDCAQVAVERLKAHFKRPAARRVSERERLIESGLLAPANSIFFTPYDAEAFKRVALEVGFPMGAGRYEGNSSIGLLHEPISQYIQSDRWKKACFDTPDEKLLKSLQDWRSVKLR